jgi:hypothetical protein
LHVWNEFVSRYNFFCLDIPCCCCCLMSCDKKYISIFQFYKSWISIFLWLEKSFPSELKTLLSTFQFCFCVTELCCQLKSGLQNHAMKTNSFFFLLKEKKSHELQFFDRVNQSLLKRSRFEIVDLTFSLDCQKGPNMFFRLIIVSCEKKYLFTFVICVCKLLRIIRIIEDKWKIIHSMVRVF